MGTREQECWEQFLKTGLVSDYLEYRGAVNYSERAPQGAVPAGEEQGNAGWDQGGGAAGQKP